MIVDPVRLIDQTYYRLLPYRFESEASTVLLIAIGLQESKFMDRYQMKGGPARGFWQFERSGVRGVLAHKSSENYAKAVCTICNVAPTIDAVHANLVMSDLLACAFARLLLWTVPTPVPTVADACWDYYRNAWRPGKERPETWNDHYETAVAMVRNAGGSNA